MLDIEQKAGIWYCIYIQLRRPGLYFYRSKMKKDNGAEKAAKEHFQPTSCLICKYMALAGQK
jgi:hypothetical protein